MNDQFNDDGFPLSRKKVKKGNRRLAREKVLQILNAYFVSEKHWLESFDHIFYRHFKFDPDEAKGDKIMTPDEINESDSDVPVKWNDEEIEFCKEIIKHIIDNNDELTEMLKKQASNWEIDRIALIDKILIQMAVVELIYFPEIPPKVSINEAIEIAKKYSTPKSGNFINGVLDALHIQLKDQGRVKKIGRGLISQTS